MHTLTSTLVRSLLASSEAERLSPEARERLAWIAFFVESGFDASATCARFSLARSTFHRWLKKFDPENLASLEERSHAPLEARLSSVPQDVVALIRAYRRLDPHRGKESIRAALAAEHGVAVSSSSIGRVIERENLFFGNTPLHWRKRMERPEEASSFELGALSTSSQQNNMFAHSSPLTPHLSHLPSHISHHDSVACSCLFCRLHRVNWKPIRRTARVAGFLVNVALVSLVAATLFWERTENQLRADLTNIEEIRTTASLDLPDGQ